jgi:hypothetical protein
MKNINKNMQYFHSTFSHNRISYGKFAAMIKREMVKNSSLDSTKLPEIGIQENL